MSRSTIQILAMITGVVGFLTALVQCSSAQDSQKEAAFATSQAETSDQVAKRLQLELDANKQRLADITAAEQQRQVMEQKSRICEEHQSRRMSLDARFSDLQSRHGTMLNFMKSCGKEKQEDQGACFTTVCAGAYFMTDGNTNCVNVAAEAGAVLQDSKIEGTAAQGDGCNSPLLAAEVFFR